jgi:hypothetical protein
MIKFLPDSQDNFAENSDDRFQTLSGTTPRELGAFP